MAAGQVVCRFCKDFLHEEDGQWRDSMGDPNCLQNVSALTETVNLAGFHEPSQVDLSARGGPVTHATLIIHDDKSSQDITAEFTVTSDDQAATIHLTPGDVKIDTKSQPKVSTGALTSSAPASGPVNLKDVLDALDPRDSDAALSLWYWLVKNQRISKIATLEGSNVGLVAYQEPQGTTKQGYTPGTSVADQIVDKMVEAVGDQTPAKHGICSKCFSAVVQGEGDEKPRLEEGDEGADLTVCSGGGDHVLA